jgi:hypothetical protein
MQSPSASPASTGQHLPSGPLVQPSVYSPAVDQAVAAIANVNQFYGHAHNAAIASDVYTRMYNPYAVHAQHK